MKRKESDRAIKCDYDCGPLFGIHPYTYDSYYYDIYIGNRCNEEDSCYIHNNGAGGYEYNPQYKSSLFVNTARADEKNWFSVLDYEVYCIDYENRDYITNYVSILILYGNILKQEIYLKNP